MQSKITQLVNNGTLLETPACGWEANAVTRDTGSITVSSDEKKKKNILKSC